MKLPRIRIQYIISTCRLWFMSRFPRRLRCGRRCNPFRTAFIARVIAGSNQLLRRSIIALFILFLHFRDGVTHGLVEAKSFLVQYKVIVQNIEGFLGYFGSRRDICSVRRRFGISCRTTVGDGDCRSLREMILASRIFDLHTRLNVINIPAELKIPIYSCRVPSIRSSSCRS